MKTKVEQLIDKYLSNDFVQFSGETKLDAFINHESLDIVEEDEFRKALDELSSDAYTRALERMKALKDRGADITAGTLRRLKATTSLEKVHGILLAAEEMGLSDVVKAANKKIKELGSRSLGSNSKLLGM
jgi:hypothetical protein